MKGWADIGGILGFALVVYVAVVLASVFLFPSSYFLLVLHEPSESFTVGEGGTG